MSSWILSPDLQPLASKILNYRSYTSWPLGELNEESDGMFRMTTLNMNGSSWWGYDYEAEIPVIIGRYLKLNLTFIIPTLFQLGKYNITGYEQKVLWIMKSQRIDFILDNKYFTEKKFHPDVISFSTAIFGFDRISVLTKKQPIDKTKLEEFEIFEPQVWLFILMTILSYSLLLYFKPRKRSNSKTQSIPGIIFVMISLFLSQSSAKLNKISKHAILYCLFFFSLFLTIFYKSTILERIMIEPQQWCNTFECFVKTSDSFLIPTDGETFNLWRKSQHIFEKKIFAKAKKKPLLEYDIEDGLDLLSGKTNVIMDSYKNEKLLSACKFASDQNNWLITAKSKYALQAGMVRKSHPKSNRIRKKINECSEFGIIRKWSQLNIDMSGFIAFSVIKNSFDEEKLEKIMLVSHQKETISLGDYKNTFKLLFYGLIITFYVLIIEIKCFIFYYQYF